MMEGNFSLVDFFLIVRRIFAYIFVTIYIKLRFVSKIGTNILEGGRFVHLWVASFIKASFVLAAANKLKT